MNQLELYRQALVGKTISGLGTDKVILETGEWWKLAVPFEGDRLEIVGRPITSAFVIDGKLELVIDKEQRLYLHWRDENGNTIGPQFPEPGKIKAWDRSESDPFWDNLDRFLKIYERCSRRQNDNSRSVEDTSKEKAAR